MSLRANIIKRTGQEHRQRLVELVEQAASSHSAWQIWDDLIYMTATALSQPLKWVKKREDEYLHRISRYDKKIQELFPQMIGEIILAFEQEGCTDILGDMYMQLELFNKWQGQFFTPSSICEMTAKMLYADLPALIEKQGYITVNDPACGGGAMLIAFAKNAQEMGINYQTDVLFSGQDVDPIVARMCYISMSLLGMPGYVIIGDTLSNPPTVPLSTDCDVWYTLMYFVHGFQWRRQRNIAEHIQTPETVLQKSDNTAPQKHVSTETYIQLSFDTILDCEQMSMEIPTGPRHIRL